MPRSTAPSAGLDSLRFESPLYTVGEAARIVDVPPSTFATWAKGYTKRFASRPAVVGKPIITYRATDMAREATIPFVGLAEGMALAAIRRSGVPLQRIRPAILMLERELGIAYALASERLFTDGVELLFDYAERASRTRQDRVASEAVRELVVVRSGQRVFVDVVQEYLRKIEYASDGYAQLIRLPAYRAARVVADPRRAFGAPIFESGGARIDDVLQRFWAGESLADLSEEFGVPEAQLEDVLRVASHRAA